MATKRRYNAAVQRVKGMLELASGLYETSLSHETRRAAEGVLQTDARLGYYLQLSLLPRGNQDDCISLSFAADSFRELKMLADGKISMAWINPSASVTLAYKGKGPLEGRMPLRTIAVFPSWDVMGFAVHESTGITSLEQISKDRIPLHLSTGPTGKRSLVDTPVAFTVASILKAAGMTVADIRKWGGTIQSVTRPSHPDRRSAIDKGTVNAVFDEGIKSWGQSAVDRGLPLPAHRRPCVAPAQGHGLPRRRVAQNAFQRHDRGRPHRRFQRLAHGSARGHAQRCRVCPVRGSRAPEENHPHRQLQASRHRAALCKRRRGALRRAPSSRRQAILPGARVPCMSDGRSPVLVPRAAAHPAPRWAAGVIS